MAKISSTRLMVAAIFGLFVYGTIASMLGTLLPELSARFHLTPEQNGSIAALQAVGLMLASIATGPLIDNKGKKTGFVIGMALIVISLVGLPNSTGAGTIMICMFLLGLGGGTIVTASNNLVSDVGEDKRASMLNFAHVFFGLGSLLTPFIAANLFEGNVILLTYIVAAMTVVALVVQATTPMPVPAPGDGFRPSEIVRLKGKPLLFILSLFVFLYVSCEVGFWNWLARYLVTRGVPERRALNILALGFGSGILLGRLIGSRVLRRYSAVSLSLACSALMAITTYWTLHTGSPAGAAVSVFCAGLAMGPVYPSSMAIAGDAFPYMTATCMGIVITSGWIGLAVSSRLIGWVASGREGLGDALLLLPAFSVAMIAILLVMRPMLARARSQSKAPAMVL
ncbi:MAG TPA: MFS transporter [Terriglobales bacterium]